ncbi:MAG: zinc ribbon domain-containing protein [Thermoleophilaceae bacterium]|nr:zinc ribbon domain-containing protein [Thermoleophilaceae bacterium]
MAFGFISEEDTVIYECEDCGERIEEQILMGTLVCPQCGGVMLPT